MPSEPLLAKAGGAIHISAFVKHSTTANQTLLEAADTTVPVMGISVEAAHDAPIPSNSNTTLAAVASGDDLRYYPPGNICRLKCSGGWTAGDQIGPTTNGSGVTISSTTAAQFVGAIALEAASDGEFGLVMVVSYPYTGT